MQYSKKDIWELSLRIDKIVQDSGMPRKDFAEMLGVKPCNLSLWTGGRCVPSLPNLIGIARFAGITVDELLDGLVEVQR